MLLSDYHIDEAIHRGDLKIAPVVHGALQPASVDLRLSHTFRLARSLVGKEQYAASDKDNSDLFDLIKVPKGEKFILPPGGFALAHTHEVVTLGNNLAARVEGKSSLGRNGQAVHITAGFIDPGFSGQVVLEIYNHLPVPFLFEPGQKIGQLCIFTMSSPVEVTYGNAAVGSHYQNQRGPQPSRSHENYETIDVYEEQS